MGRGAFEIGAFATLVVVVALVAAKLPRGPVDLNGLPANAGGAEPAGEAKPAHGKVPPLPEDGEPSNEDCLAAVEKVRALASELPVDHPSRYIAERYLHQSMAESGNGESEDCVEWAERAEEEVRGLRHAEKLKVLQSDEVPASAAPSVSDEGAKSGHNKRRR